MSHVISLRLRDDQIERLRKAARRLNQKTPTAAAQMLLEEKLREAEFANITFRTTPLGREAFVEGTGLTVWEVMMLMRAYEQHILQVAAHLEIPETLVRSAVHYAEAFPDEIDAALAENDVQNEETLKRLIPNLEVIHLSVDEPVP